MALPARGAVLLGTADPERLRAWYSAALQTEPDECGLFDLGGFGVLIDRRDDVAGTNLEPTRVALKVYVDDAPALAERFEAAGGVVLPAADDAEPGSFGTVSDPDGNRLHIIWVTDARPSA
jgi:predicted enzyme related to lactoylglutathione lyase